MSNFFSSRTCFVPCNTGVCAYFVPLCTFKAVSNALIPSVADVTFVVTNVPVGTVLSTPLYVNPLYGGSTTLSQVIPQQGVASSWCITNVPWGSTMSISFNLTPSFDSECADQDVAVLKITVPQYVSRLGAPMGNVLLLAWLVSAKTTCLTFGWAITGAGTGTGTGTDGTSAVSAVLYSVVDVQGVVLAENVLAADVTSVTINDLWPDTEYIFTIRGLYETPNSTTSTAVSLPVIGVTLLPYLGPNYSFNQASVYDVTTNTWTLSVAYSDYACVSSITSVTNSSGTAAVVKRRIGTTLPLQFTIAGVPSGTGLYVGIKALADPKCVCGCVCVGSTDLDLTGLLLINAPPAPDVCANIAPVTNLSLTAAGATCLAVSWTPTTSSFGYVCTLTNSDGSIVIDQQTFHDQTTAQATFAGLPASTTDETTYGVEVTVICDDAQVAPSSIQVSTPAACTPSLGPVVLSSDVGIVLAPNGTYTATISYNNFTCTNPGLAWATTTHVPALAVIYPPASLAVPVPQWIITGLPASPTSESYGLTFTGMPLQPSTQCTSSCCVATTIVPSPVTFSITVPPSSCGVVSNVACSAQTQSTLTFTWQWSGTVPPTSFQYYVNDNTGTVVTIPGTPPNTVTLTGLTAGTSYTLHVRAVCGSIFTLYAYGTGTTSTPTPVASLAPFVQTLTNPTFTPNTAAGAAADTFVMALTYPLDLAVGIQTATLQLVSELVPPLVITRTGSNVFHAVVEQTTYTFYMSAQANAGIPPATVTSTGFSIVVSAPAPGPGHASLFDLIIPNYAGPPSAIASCCKNIEASSAAAIYATLEATSPLSPSSYAKMFSMFNNYADVIVERFVKYRMQTQQTVLGYSLYTPISRIYFANTIDPTIQNFITPVAVTKKDGDVYEASFSYNTAMIAYPTNPPTASSFVVPPFLVAYKKMMIYNWEMTKLKHVNNSPVQLGATMYGSEKADEVWWFNAVVNSMTGAVVPVAPTNPLLSPSIIDTTPNDGNGTGTSFQDAGWNCMERWFMHIAYCNQVLRFMIQDGQIKSTLAGTMTVSDLSPTNAVYFQISCLTFDGEGNTFLNTLYPDIFTTIQYYEAWFSTITPAMCNATIALLWNKWINQAPAPEILSSDNTLLKNPSWKTAYYAQYGRLYMPPGGFTLPPAISMTTPGLIKNMKTSDLGSPDFSSVDLIFNEIYDTSDSQPTYCLGVATTPPANLYFSPPLTTGGAAFTQDVQTAALSNSTFIAYPEKYSASYGSWDNMPGNVGPNTTTTEITVITDAGTLSNAAVKVTDPNTGTVTALTGSTTVYNTGGKSQQFCALMNTSQFTPWNNAATTPWMLTYVGPVTPNNVSGAYKDYYALPWALEGSRYDLYNGAWAAAAATASASKEINYDDVKQGSSGANGALLWSDLSTGLKPRVAARIKGIYVGVQAMGTDSAAIVTQTTASLAGQVWMLSCQAGPFVNAMGVRASKRDGTGGAAPDDLLTFTYPGGDWPGWAGMKGQWWGPGARVNANLNKKVIIDQQKWGPADTTPPDTILGTNSSEDNFGVFADYNIQFAAWVQMALDAQGIVNTDGKGSAASSSGITAAVPIMYTTVGEGTGVPKLGCYELGFLPMSWFVPAV